MARYAQGTRIDFPEITAIKRELAARFAPNIRAKFLGAALNKATKPVARSLKQNTKKTFKRVSGNLERSVASVVRRYYKTGNAVGVVGYTKAGGGKTTATKGTIQKGKDRAFHAGLLIFGTKQRRTKKGSIASSYKTRGPFVLKKAKRGKFAGSARVRTVPKYPRAFFKRGEKGSGVDLGRIYGQDVITQTLNQNASMIRQILRQEMSTVVERAARFLEIKFPPRKS
jgi:hypothetical protein